MFVQQQLALAAFWRLLLSYLSISLHGPFRVPQLVLRVYSGALHEERNGLQPQFRGLSVFYVYEDINLWLRKYPIKLTCAFLYMQDWSFRNSSQIRCWALTFEKSGNTRDSCV
jgi:hypothetical protein